jgi:hypothetical protein
MRIYFVLLVDVFLEGQTDGMKVGDPVSDRLVDGTHLLKLFSVFGHFIRPAQHGFESAAAHGRRDKPHIGFLFRRSFVVDLSLADGPQEGGEDGGSGEGSSHKLVQLFLWRSLTLLV